MFWVWRVADKVVQKGQQEYRMSAYQPRSVGGGQFIPGGYTVQLFGDLAEQIAGHQLERGECVVIPKRGSGEPE